MEKWKNIGKALLFPHKILVVILFPIAMIFLIFSILYFGTEHIVSYISYVLAFYSLMIVSVRVPSIIKFIIKFKNENKYIVKYNNDINLQVNISLYGSLIINIIYSIFQFCLGLSHKSFWFYSMSLYYVLLSLVRFYLLKYTRRNKPGVDLLNEYKRYNVCGWIMLLMNFSVTAIIFFIIYFDRTYYYHQITTIALAAYTFITFGSSIYSFIKFRRYKSPVYQAVKSFNLIDGTVSMMTLTTTMLTTFGTIEIVEFKKILLTIVGIMISLFILITSIQIIFVTNKNIKKLKNTCF